MRKTVIRGSRLGVRVLLVTLGVWLWTLDLQADFKIAYVNYNVPSATGNSSITGLTFQPKAMIAYWTLTVGNGGAADYNLGIGFAANNAGTTQQSSMATSEQTSPATNSNCHGSQSNLKAFYHEDNGGTLRLSGFIASWNADGVTITWSAVKFGAIVQFIFLGGSDITNVAVGTTGKSTAAAPVDQDITTPAFQPSVVILTQQYSTTDENTTDATTSHRWSLGFATPSSRFVASHGIMNTGFSVQHAQISTALSHLHAGADIALADITAFIPLGFRLNWSVNEANARRMNWLAIKGGGYAVGTFNQATVGGNQSVSGLSVAPAGTLFVSANDVASAAINNVARMSIGFGIDGSNRGSIWSGYSATNQFATQVTDTTKVIRTLTEGAAGSATANTSADFVSSDATGFTIQNVVTDATSREIGYLSFGTPIVVGPPPFFLDQD